MLKKVKNITINFGPQHPAAHGVLRLVIELIGESIVKVDAHIGLLHRGTEKLIEAKIYNQGLPYMDRLDYVSTMAQEHCYSLAIESLIKVNITYKASLLRMLFCEITRILNNLLALTTHALDVGALTPFLWGFDLREYLMEYYERVCGARLHAAYIRPGGVISDLSIELLWDLDTFSLNFDKRLDEIMELLLKNRVWVARLFNIGIVSYKKVQDWAYSGVLLRGSGFSWDLRFFDNYENYLNYGNYQIGSGSNGDSYDRFNLRLFELRQSNFLIRSFLKDLFLIEQNSNYLDSNSFVNNKKIIKPFRGFLKRDMESLIQHFKLYTEGFFVNTNESYRVVEAPKGEFAIGLTSDKTSKPYRCRIKAPGFLHLQGLNFMSKNLLLADMVTNIGTLDLVLGEIDK
jgi:NADH dehydrogenase (ubiquinone) Fe-S protein 2